MSEGRKPINSRKLIIALIGMSGMLVMTLVVAFIVVFIGKAWWGNPFPILGFDQAPDQPVAFPHDTHAGTLQIDCQFCHRTVTKGAEAGIPSVEQCMFCHTTIGQGKPEIEKVRQASQNGDPIEWKRVHRLPDHVQFFHAPHIAAGFTCSTCHGDVATMQKVGQVRPLKMADCVNCHRDNNAPTDCATCHY